MTERDDRRARLREFTTEERVIFRRVCWDLEAELRASETDRLELAKWKVSCRHCESPLAEPPDVFRCPECEDTDE